MNRLASMGICGTRRKKRKGCACLTRVVVGSSCAYVVRGDVSVGVVGAGTVDHSGFYPWAMVVLVVCTPWVVWSSLWALPVLKMKKGFFPNVALRLPLAREVTPCFGVSDPQDLCGRIVFSIVYGIFCFCVVLLCFSLFFSLLLFLLFVFSFFFILKTS